MLGLAGELKSAHVELSQWQLCLSTCCSTAASRAGSAQPKHTWRWQLVRHICATAQLQPAGGSMWLDLQLSA
jgi:hypothetical protein